jgi:hypothetical protein
MPWDIDKLRTGELDRMIAVVDDRRLKAQAAALRAGAG